MFSVHSTSISYVGHFFECEKTLPCSSTLKTVGFISSEINNLPVEIKNAYLKKNPTHAEVITSSTLIKTSSAKR